jgi:hypothetical protein
VELDVVGLVGADSVGVELDVVGLGGADLVSRGLVGVELDVVATWIVTLLSVKLKFVNAIVIPSSSQSLNSSSLIL